MNRYLNVRSKIFLLYLRSLRSYFESGHVHKTTFKYFALFGWSLYAYKWIQQNWMKHEFDIRRQPNILIPKFIYKARREHYIYWEQSRLARGLSTTFTYYDWDPSSEMVCYTSKDGTQRFEKSIFNRERIDIIDNPLFEEIFRSEMTPKLRKRGSLLMAYETNRDNRYDLDNYLHYKPINPFDFIRAGYYYIYIKLGLANKYRYDQFLSKPDWIYNFEKIKLALNPNDRYNYFNNLKQLL
ncbi:hypothetical protein pb186bvf_006524 [Paramecium bursaria]